MSKKLSISLALLLTCFLVPQISHATDYYVSVNGDGADYTLAEAMAYANQNTNEEITFLMRDGNYEEFDFLNPQQRTAIVTFKSINKHKTIFSTIKIESLSQIDGKIVLDGFEVFQNPETKPTPTGRWILGYSLGNIDNVNYVTITNSYLHGFDKYVVGGIVATRSEFFQFTDNVIHTLRGNTPKIDSYSNNSLIARNQVYNISDGSGFSIQEGVHNTIIENNSLYNCHWNYSDNYFPTYLYDSGSNDWHPGSAFVIRSSDAIIRNNTLHDCTGLAQALYTYDGYGAYNNLLIENNLFYDTSSIRFENLGPSLNKPIIIRNNTFIGYVTTEGNSKYNILQRYDGGPNVAFDPGYDGKGLSFTNNLIVGDYPLPANSYDYSEDYNILWARDGTNGLPNGKGGNTRVSVWLGGSPSYTLHGYPNLFENVNFRENTPEYNYGTNGIKSFFVNPGFYTGNIGGYDKGRYDLDYHPLTSSIVCDGSINGQPGVASAGALPCVGAVTPSTTLHGDMDKSGTITSADAVLAASAAIGIITLTTDEQHLADVSNDGTVTAYDAALILQKSLGLIESFPVGN